MPNARRKTLRDGRIRALKNTNVAHQYAFGTQREANWYGGLRLCHDQEMIFARQKAAHLRQLRQRKTIPLPTLRITHDGALNSPLMPLPGRRAQNPISAIKDKRESHERSALGQYSKGRTLRRNTGQMEREADLQFQT